MLSEYENIIQIIASLVAGSILGIERGFHGKPAGFKTMILICVSSCLFTILSVNLVSGDRIASNIVTGIGFIGAGVVFKEGGNIRGITSAAIIWMAAAIGMCIGYQHYILAIFVLCVVLLVMVMFYKFERIFDTFHHSKLYLIHFLSSEYSLVDLEKEMSELKISYKRRKIGKKNNMVNVEYNMLIYPTEKLDKIDNFLINNTHINGFDV